MVLPPADIKTYEDFCLWIEKAMKEKEIVNFHDILNIDYTKALESQGFDSDFIRLFLYFAHEYLKYPENLDKLSDHDRQFIKYKEACLPLFRFYP